MVSFWKSKLRALSTTRERRLKLLNTFSVFLALPLIVHCDCVFEVSMDDTTLHDSKGPVNVWQPLCTPEVKSHQVLVQDS